VIERPKKGFGIPLATWLRGPLERRIADVVKQSPIWDADVLNQAVFQEKNREHQAKKKDHSKPLWALIVLDRWVRRAKAAVASV
jgi:asparagine synthase (glutamine-hydrolysing)